MARPKTAHPTEAELQILQIIWSRGRATKRDIEDDLRKVKELGDTTVSTMISVMMEKGLLVVVDERKPRIYTARNSREQTAGRMMGDLKKRLFGNSLSDLVVSFLGGRKPKREEILEARALLDKLEEKPSSTSAPVQE